MDYIFVAASARNKLRDIIQIEKHVSRFSINLHRREVVWKMEFSRLLLLLFSIL